MEYIKNQNSIIDNIIKLKKYSIYFPSTGIEYLIPINLVSKKRLIEVIQKYDPNADSEYAFSIAKIFEKTTMYKKDIKQILKTEYKRFNYIFDIIDKCNGT